MLLFKKQYYLHLIRDIHGRNAQPLLTPNIVQVIIKAFFYAVKYMRKARARKAMIG